MKHLLPFALLFFLSMQLSFAQEITDKTSSLQWENSYKISQKKSKKEHKPILIYFTGSDWCGPCKVLDKKLFHTQKFIEYASKNLILYKADLPRNKDLVDTKTKETNDVLRKKYNQKSFPTIIIVNDKGEELGVKRGMYMTEYYFPFFKSVVNKF